MDPITEDAFLDEFEKISAISNGSKRLLASLVIGSAPGLVAGGYLKPSRKDINESNGSLLKARAKNALSGGATSLALTAPFLFPSHVDRDRNDFRSAAYDIRKGTSNLSKKLMNIPKTIKAKGLAKEELSKLKMTDNEPASQKAVDIANAGINKAITKFHKRKKKR